MSDRAAGVLRNIDDTLDGALDDFNVSGDAMRWHPLEQPLPEEPEIALPPDSVGAELAEAFEEVGRMVRELLDGIHAGFAEQARKPPTTGPKRRYTGNPKYH